MSVLRAGVMAHRPGHATRVSLLGTLTVPVLFACAGETSADPHAGHTGDAATSGGAGGSSGHETGSAAGTGGAASTGSGGAAACEANRAPGIPINAGTLSASVDARIVSGDATILWAAGSNTLNLEATDGSTLTVVFPGCTAKPYSIPSEASPPDPISITYTDGGGEPQWACTYEDRNLDAGANCTVDVKAYGDRRDSPVTGTFSGVVRLMRGTGASTRTVSAGTFTFGRP
jgi:hypothetical protein